MPWLLADEYLSTLYSTLHCHLFINARHSAHGHIGLSPTAYFIPTRN